MLEVNEENPPFMITLLQVENLMWIICHGNNIKVRYCVIVGT
jgi:hypothetical protein